MTVDQAAEAIGMSRAYLGYLVRAGRVRATRGRRNSWVIDEAQVEELREWFGAKPVQAPTAIDELKALGRENWEPQHWNLAKAIAADSHLGLLSTKTLTRYLEQKQGRPS